MGNQLRKKVPEEDYKFLKANTDFAKSDIVDYYKKFMKNHPDGHMSLNEFKEFLHEYYKDKSNILAEHYFRAADKDGSGEIDFKEFLLFLNHECTSNPKERLQWMFDLFDVKGNGVIDKEEMIHIYQVSLKKKCKTSSDLCGTQYLRSPDEFGTKMFEKCDESKDNVVTKEEFVATVMEDPVLFAIFCRTSDAHYFHTVHHTTSY